MNTYRIELAWNPSPSTGVTGYRIYSGPAAGDYTAHQDVGPQTYATIKVQAETGDQLHMAITALDGSTGLESAFSTEAITTAPPPPEIPVVVQTKPEPPTGLKVVSITFAA